MRRPFFLLIVIVFGLWRPNAGHAADKWISVRSRNFLLVGNASESQVRRVGRNLEEFRAALATLFPGIGQNSTQGTTVVVFKDDTSFRPYKPLYEGKPANIAGVFQSGSDVNFIALTGDSRSTHVIYHELVHSLTREAGSPLPPWASEGVAELYSTFEIAANGKQLNLGRPINPHIITLRDRPFLPLETFFAVERDSPHYNEKSKQGIFYAQSWATVHYLMMANNGQRRPQFVKYLGLLAAGKPRDESFREAFQTDHPTFEKELDEYVRARYSLPGLIFDLQNKLDFDREMQVASLSEAQAQYYLGDLLLHLNRLDAAEAHLQKAISLDSKAGGGYASMGLLRMRQDRDEDALKYLTQAVEADSQNHMVHYYYASMLRRDGRASGDRQSQMELMRTHLKKSIELAPRYVEAYNLLSYVAAVLDDELEETEELVKKAIGFAPGRQDLRLSQIQLMLRNNKAQAARVLAIQLRDTATDDDIRGRAGQFMEQASARLKYESELREYNERRRAAELATPPAARTEETRSDGPPRLTRNTTGAAGESTSETTTSVPVRRPAGIEIEGFLTLIDCARGATFRLRVGNGIVELYSENPSQIELKSYVSTVAESIPCGPIRPERPVRIIYRRGGDPRFLGIPLLIEFIEKKPGA